MKKIKSLLIILLMIPLFVKSGSFSSEANLVNNYLKRSNFVNTYQRYLIYKTDSYSVPFGFKDGKVENSNQFVNGGFISLEEYKLTLPSKGTSYLYDGTNIWTLSKSGNKYSVIEFKGNNSDGISSYEENTTSVSIRVMKKILLI